MFAASGAGGIGNNFAVRDGRIALVYNERDAKDRFVSRLIEGWEGTARIRGLKLRHRVPPPCGLAQIKPAKLVVQNSGKANMNLRSTRRNDSRHRYSRGFVFLIRGHRGSLFEIRRADPCLFKLELRGIQDDGRGRLLQMNVNRLIARRMWRRQDRVQISSRKSPARHYLAASVR